MVSSVWSGKDSPVKVSSSPAAITADPYEVVELPISRT